MAAEEIESRTSTRTLSAIAGIGVAIFLIVVVLLHFAQPGYDPLTQFMSELALGRHGVMMLLAFLGLAIAGAASAASIHAHGAPLSLAVLLGLASLCFLGAGLVTLDISAQVHVSLVAFAFVSCGVSMYLLPSSVDAFSSIGYRVASWGSCFAMSVTTGLGGSVILPGVAQRLSAAALLFWLSMVAWRLKGPMKQ